MSATSTLFSSETAEWIRLFSDQETNTYTSSVRFMKQLTTIAVGTLTFLRDLFPVDSYVSEKFGGITVRTLRRKCRNENAQFMSTALIQSFEAFDKKYLQRLAICFYEDDETKAENLIEYWLFEYTYDEDKVSMNVRSSNRESETRVPTYVFNEIKSQTQQLLRSIIVTLEKAPKQIPDNVVISLRLYYNESAPEGYQPEGFLATLEDRDHLEPTLSKSLKMGYVKTRFHTMVAKSYISEEMPDSNQPNASSTPPKLTQFQYNSESSSKKPLSRSNASESSLQCPCELSDDEDYSDEAYLICHYCNTSQHASCYGVYREDVAGLLHHCCSYCSDADPTLTPTDPELAAHKDRTVRQWLCKFRRTLHWTSNETSLSAEDVVVKYRLSPHKAIKVLHMYYKNNIIKESPTDSLVQRYDLDHTNLISYMAKFFRKRAGNIVEQLISESLSQESNADPVRDALGPKGAEQLLNTSTIGKVIEPDRPETEESPTLKEYREAMMPINENAELLFVSQNKENKTFRRRKIDKEEKTEIGCKRIKKK